jgi:hypothetical protein
MRCHLVQKDKTGKNLWVGHFVEAAWTKTTHFICQTVELINPGKTKSCMPTLTLYAHLQYYRPFVTLPYVDPLTTPDPKQQEVVLLCCYTLATKVLLFAEDIVSGEYVIPDGFFPACSKKHLL